MEYQFRPIDKWPGERTRSRRKSRFGSSWTSTIDLLEKELRFLNGKNVVIQAEVSSSDVRQDGMLRANARPHSPGIILSFDSKHGPLSYPCDTFDDWQDNVRAIALALGSLRSVDRYGVTRRAEQYKGWAKLPPPLVRTKFHSRADALLFLARVLGQPVDGNEPFISNAVRRAKVKTHPDQGGSADMFKQVCVAAEFLGVS